MEQDMAASDAVEDPDDVGAARVMLAMFFLVKIGDESFGNDHEALARKMDWIEALGPQGGMMVSGLYAQMHEVAHGVIAEFLDSSTPLE